MKFDVVVIGGGPAGLAAAISAFDSKAKVALIERENRLGGVLKQCIHDGFGLLIFKEQLTGPEYAEKFITQLNNRDIKIFTETFVITITKAEKGSFTLKAVNQTGVINIESKCIIFATGCRERTAKQIGIHGTRPSGIYTAGMAQYLVNIEGLKIGKKCVILGSGDIGLIMARRLVLEGTEVLGVYEIQHRPSGLKRNIVQCLDDYNIPLHLGHTVSKVFGNNRLEAVEIVEVDEIGIPINQTEQRIECDTLILSVGLIPENELINQLHVKIDPNTGGPYINCNMETTVSGVFCCGNALHVNDLVDYVSETGTIAGYEAAKRGLKNYTTDEIYKDIEIDEKIRIIVPQRFNSSCDNKIFFFRVKDEIINCTLKVYDNDKIIYSKQYGVLRPPEMVRIDLKQIELQNLKFTLEEN